MRRFELLEPTSLEEATNLLVEMEDRAAILAGGTDLLVNLKREKVAPQALVSLRCIPGLSFIRREKGSVKLGACTTLRAVEKSSLVRRSLPALGDAADNFGSIQVRNLATIGGNICNAMPSADTVPPLLVHDARLGIHGPKGGRELPLADFFVGPGKTRLEIGEVLTEMTLPIPSDRTESAYIKLIRRSSMELPLVAAAARISFDSSGTILDGRIALACASPTCFRARGAEALLPGKRVTEKFLQEIGMAALEESKPRDSIRCSARYRKEMIPILVARSVRRCYEKSFGEEGRSR